MATLKEVSREIKIGLEGFSTTLMREVALDYTTNSKKRIFTDGVGGDGNSLGNYAASTIKQKKKKGRFTSNNVNLRATETLANSYLLEQKGLDWVVGFAAITKDGVSNSNKKKYLEERYGSDVFDATNEELNRVDVLIKKLKLF